MMSMIRKRLCLAALSFSLLCATMAPLAAQNYGPGMSDDGSLGTGAGNDTAVSGETPDYWTWKVQEIASYSRYSYGPELLANWTEGDYAAGYYYDCMYQYSDNKSYQSEYIQAVREQYLRIEENPTPETAAAEMVTVEIPVWRLSNGQKVASTTHVQVLSSIADEVVAIFTEIFNGPEQFPISSVGGYSWRSNGLGSGHSSGTALDINPDHNPQVSPDGQILVGGAWEPYTNPYSITPDGDVAKAFGKYGWGWGAAYNTKDYMHFEF